jgi:hypothetical protein
MACDYEADMTMVEIEAKHKLSHGAVLRALRRAGVEMRPKGRQTNGSAAHIGDTGQWLDW